MASIQREQLIGHTSRSGIALSGGCAVAFGLPFLLMGSFVLAASSGFLKADFNRAPAPVVMGIGGLFAGVGLWIVLGGLQRSFAARRAARAKRNHLGEPWLWDYRWDEQAARAGGLGSVISGILGLAFFALFAAPFNWAGFREGLVPFAIAALILDLLVLAVLGVFLYQFARWIRYGKSTLRFTTFPYFLGSSLDVILPGSRRLRGFNRLVFWLRCVEEGFESRGNSNQVVCYRVYEDTQTLEKGMDASLEMDVLPISFPLPDGDFETRLSAQPPRYWELEVKADTPGVDYSATFLLPVYAPPGSRAARAAEQRDTSPTSPSPPSPPSGAGTLRGNLKPTPRR